MEELIKQLKEKQRHLFFQNERFKEMTMSYETLICECKSAIKKDPTNTNTLHFVDSEYSDEYVYSKLLFYRECKKKIDKKITRNKKQINEIIKQINLLSKKEA